MAYDKLEFYTFILGRLDVAMKRNEMEDYLSTHK